MPDESKSIALTSFAVIAVIALAVFILVWLRHSPSRTCADNLRQISAALGMYLDDSDQRFPPSYTAYYDDVGIHCAAWDSLIDPYIGSHIAPQAGWAYVDSWDEAVVPGSGLTTSVTPPLAPWHCPADAGAGPLSYGLNSVVSGAYKIFHTKAVAERFVRAQEWQDSLTFSQISDPNNVVWAGDTNRLWDASHKVYTEAFPEWPRRTDCYLRDLTDPQFVDWYRGFLARDLTDYEGSCPYPLAWGCRAPAYRHDTSGRRSAMMLFCDGHVRSVPVGELRVQNIFPSTELSSFGFHKNAVSADPQIVNLLHPRVISQVLQRSAQDVNRFLEFAEFRFHDSQE